MRRAVAGVLLAVLFTAGAVGAGAVTTSNANTRGVVLFVGDSNMTLGAADRLDVDGAGAHQQRLCTGARIPRRRGDPLAELHRPHGLHPFRLLGAEARLHPAKVSADAIVNGLGINDTARPGTTTTPGYYHYGLKIDWFMSLVGGKRVLWTTLPCAIEPHSRLTGCYTVNHALLHARDRWPNLTVVLWNEVANSHPTYMAWPGQDVHYSSAGEEAWSNLVVDALDARFRAP